MDDLAKAQGCHEPRDVPYQFDEGRITLYRCPMHVLNQPDPYRSAIVAAYHDREAGVLEGWPDTYAAWLEDGVRYLAAEIRASERDYYDRKEREAADRRRRA